MQVEEKVTAVNAAIVLTSYYKHLVQLYRRQRDIEFNISNRYKF